MLTKIFIYLNNKINYHLIPKEIQLDFGSEIRTRAQILTRAILLVFLALIPGALFIANKFPNQIGFMPLYIILIITMGPLIIFKKTKRINLTVFLFSSALILFGMGSYLLFDRPFSTIIFWAPIILLFNMICSNSHWKYSISVFQLLGIVISVVIKFNFDEDIRLIVPDPNHDVRRIIISFLFMNLSAFLLVQTKINMLTAGKKEKEVNDSNNIYLNRLKATRTFSIGIAHEVNNPLTIAKGNLYRLKKEITIKENPDVYARLAKVDKSLERIEFIVHKLLSWTNLDGETTNSEIIAFDSLIFPLVSDLEFEARQRQVEFTFSLIDTKLSTQYNALKVALTELLKNAIEEAAKSDEPKVFLNTSCDFTWLEIQVGNTGDPISAENEKLIYDPFFSTKPTGGGMGLGLFMVRAVVEQFDGKITLTREDDFTIFTLFIPVHLNKSKINIHKANCIS